MKIFVTIRPGAKQEEIKSIDGTHLTIRVKEQPHEGKANDAVIRALAEHFGMAASRIRIVKGFSSRNKIIEIV